MTVKELEQLAYLDKIIRYEQDKLDDLRASVDLHSPGLSDMPKAHGARDKLGDTVPKIVDNTREIEENILLYQKTRERLLDYINRVPFVRVKMIMKLRFIEQKTWQEVADYIDNGTGKETSDSVRMAVNAYLSQEAGNHQ